MRDKLLGRWMWMSIAIVLAALGGCMDGAVVDEGGALGTGGGGNGSGTGTGTGSGTLLFDPCAVSKGGGLDPASKPGWNSCCTKGDAHCVPASKVSSKFHDGFSSCDAEGSAPGVCMPDALIKAGSRYQQKTCTSLQATSGVCISKCIPRLANDPQAILLPQDVCAEDELCVPCVNPLNGTATGACGLQEALCSGEEPGTGTGTGSGTDGGMTLMCPYTGPAVVNPATFPACAPVCGGAHCVPSALVPAAQQGQLAACAGGFCAPDKMIAAAGNYVPPTCAPFPGTQIEGRCLSSCLPSVSAQAARLAKQTCDAGELCVPCFDPLTGAATGACTTSCDMPKQPAVKFPTCCESKATCVPTAQIPTAQQSSVEQDTCPTAFSCVPNENLPGSTASPTACTARLGAGTCVSKCAKLPLGGFIFLQDVCTPDQVCVPCALARDIPGCTP